MDISQHEGPSPGPCEGANPSPSVEGSSWLLHAKDHDDPSPVLRAVDHSSELMNGPERAIHQMRLGPSSLLKKSHETIGLSITLAYWLKKNRKLKKPITFL